MSKKKRALYLEIIKRNVEYLVEHDLHDELGLVMEGTGYFENTSTTSAELGAAIVALAGVIPDYWLRRTVEGAVFYREYGPWKTRRRHTERWNRASALSDYAVRSPELVVHELREGSSAEAH